MGSRKKKSGKKKSGKKKPGNKNNGEQSPLPSSAGNLLDDRPNDSTTPHKKSLTDGAKDVTTPTRKDGLPDGGSEGFATTLKKESWTSVVSGGAGSTSTKSREGSQRDSESDHSFHSARSQNDSRSDHSFRSAVSYHNPPNAPKIGQDTPSLSQSRLET